ncbi:MAG: hypothetical protein ACPG7F_10230, partial [Aggregatilineales bacterium]
MKTNIVKALSIVVSMVLVTVIVSAQGPGGGQGRGGQNSLEFDDSVVQVELDISDYTTYGDALTAQVDAGDGAGIDGT